MSVYRVVFTCRRGELLAQPLVCTSRLVPGRRTEDWFQNTPIMTGVPVCALCSLYLCVTLCASVCSVLFGAARSGRAPALAARGPCGVLGLGLSPVALPAYKKHHTQTLSAWTPHSSNHPHRRRYFTSLLSIEGLPDTESMV